VGAAEEGMAPVAKPYKLKFKVAIQPLKMSLGYEQYSAKDEPGLADKSKRFLEITVYEGGATRVSVNVARKEDSTGDEKKVTDSLTVGAKAGKFYGQVELSTPPGFDYSAGEGLGPPSVNLLAAMQLGEGQVNAGATLTLPQFGGPDTGRGLAGGISVFGHLPEL
jgi:hypothetical protein